jgi:hypothetical protein
MGYELAIQGIAELFGWSNDIPTQAVGSGITLFLSAWQAKNAERAVGRLRHEMQHLDQRKLDRSFVHSDEFKEFVIQVFKNESETASEVKQEAFVRLTMNTLQGSLETFKDKHLLRRLLDQISETEITALITLSQVEEELRKNPVSEEESTFYRSEYHLSRRLGWSKEDTSIATAGLQQLGLVTDGVIMEDHQFTPQTPRWSTDLAVRLIQAIQNQNLSSDSQDQTRSRSR